LTRWLFKTEPGAYSWQQLESDGRTVWDGVKNALALKHLRAVAEGDEILIYHTGDEKAAVGIAVATRGAYPDPKQKDARAVVVDLRPVRALARPVALAEMRKERKLADFELLRLPRLSVMPVSAAHWAAILRLAEAGASKR
jgi:predicted RNA-binding protein with PUA-like domain